MESEQQPMMEDSPANKERLWLLYAQFCGDVERTAFAAGLRPIDVLDAAAAGGWNDKLRAILALKKSAAPGDVERAISRSIAFVQAHRMRGVIDRVLLGLSLLDNNEFEEHFFTGPVGKDGHVPKKLSTRALADLASAMEKVNSVISQALCDTSQDRSKRDEATEGGDASGSIHAAIAAAMAAIGDDKSPAALLLDAQLASVKNITGRSQVVSGNPHDSDEH